MLSGTVRFRAVITF
ncbi:unnamed protein product [Podospora anserina S mat+]|uniref:Podospora anserina S mat+ genomic DNA chromosome 7, supercontig 3 n=1 Tax=Podospora anserina (strain S / ATCC MYA-4624 / DSM 980 / FGSC 10383) TaxID=515849 RepID=B2AP67_PODAN|nr:unnamed protein product [Podospora anserina S mat+]CDP32835.1 Putative protein of unknown function [Podospora anserina S mat+]